MTTSTRRQFLQELTLGGVAAVVTNRLKPLAVPQAVDAAQWRSRIGVRLYTRRDRLTAITKARSRSSPK